MQINYAAELKKLIAKYNKTGNPKDFNNMIPTLVNTRLNFAIALQNIKNSETAGDELKKRAEFYGVFLRTQIKKDSYLVAFTDEAEMRRGEPVCTVSFSMKEYCEALEKTDAAGIIVNPFSQEHQMFLSRELVINEMLPAIHKANVINSIQNGADDGKLIYEGSYFMQYKTMPAEFFNETAGFINNMLNDKTEFIKKHLMVSQLMVCRRQDEIDGITDEEQKKERANRVMIAKGKAYNPDDYFFADVSQENPKLYILDFPQYMQTPVLCKRMYFVQGDNGKKAVYTIEVSYNGTSYLGEITQEQKHINHGEISVDSAFDETKKILELFASE